jgi:hypothetical protein
MALSYGNKLFTACTVKFWREDKSKPKKANKEGAMVYPRVPMYIRRIWVEIITPNNDGMVWCFVGMKRGGAIRWTDGRKYITDLGSVSTEKAYTDATLRNEIARMTSFDFADQVFAAMVGEVNAEEHADMIGAHFVPTFGVRDVKDDDEDSATYGKTIGSEDYEGRELEGGYIDRVKSAIAAVKARRVDKAKVNRFR